LFCVALKNGKSPPKSNHNQIEGIMDHDGGSPTVDEGGGWESVGPAGKKAAKGKKGNKGKMKNARTLSLQTFFSEHGGSEEGADMLEEPELTPEELLARESLLTYFADLIRRSGPLKVNGPAIRTHLEDRMTDGESLLSGKAIVEIDQMPNFLSSSPDLIIVDDIVCDKRHGSQAKTAALTQILTNFEALSSNLKRPGSANSSAGSPGPLGAGGAPSAPSGGGPQGNVWNKGPPAGTSGSDPAPDPLLQLPNRVESLFNGGGHHSGFGQIVPSQSPARASPASNISSNLPDLSSPPPPLPLNNSSLTANHLTGRQMESDLDLNRTLNRATALEHRNTELLENLKEHEKKNTNLQQKVTVLEQQLTEAQDEITRLKCLTTTSSTDDQNSAMAIFSLKKELESERLNSANLKRQLDMERQLGKSVQEKHSSLLGKLQSFMATDVTAAGAGTAAGGGLTSSGQSSAPVSSSFSSPFADSFGFAGFSAPRTSSNNVPSFTPSSSNLSSSTVQPVATSALGQVGASALGQVGANALGQVGALSQPSTLGQASAFSSATNVLADFGISSAAAQQPKLFANPPPPSSTAGPASLAGSRLLGQQRLPTTADLYKQFGQLGS